MRRNGKTNFGDCILIDTGTSLVIFDCGHQKHAERVLAYMKKEGYKEAEFILSHNDSDHFDGLAVHEDTKNIHIHFVFNAVSHVDGKKYHGGKTEYKELFHLCSGIIDQAHLSPLIAVNYHPNPLDIQNSNE